MLKYSERNVVIQKDLARAHEAKGKRLSAQNVKLTKESPDIFNFNHFV